MLFLPATCVRAATETVLWNFNGSDGEPSFPYNDSLIRDRSGNLFGVTAMGGTYNSGCVFEMSPAANGGWTRHVLYSFSKAANTDLTGGLVKDESGNLFGVSSQGGSNDSGFVYELSPSNSGPWELAILHTFPPCCVAPTDGLAPFAGLTMDSKGNLYGATTGGGTSSLGTIYELSRQSNGQWTETLLHSFTDYHVEGGYPNSRLVLDAAGNIFGTTPQGGIVNGDCSVGCGTIYELTQSNGSWEFKTLHRFNGADGLEPAYAGPVMDGAGNLYGAATTGGAFYAGVIWEERYSSTTNSYTEATLFNFESGPAEGGGSPLSITLDRQGNAYGTTAVTLYSFGTVYKLTRSKSGGLTETPLYEFMNGNDGGYLSGGVVLDDAGILFGLSEGGGAFGDGVLYEVTQP